MTDLKWFIFLVLTEIISKLLHRQHVIMIGPWDWPITAGRQWPPDIIVMTAVTKQKSTISKEINGTALRIIFIARKFLFFISWFIIHLEISWNALKSMRKIILACDSISKNWHVANVKTEKKPKITFFDFGVFQKIMPMLSRDKIIYHMLFGAFYDTLPISLL